MGEGGCVGGKVGRGFRGEMEVSHKRVVSVEVIVLSGGCVVGKSFVYLDEDVCTVVTSEDQPCISTQKHRSFVSGKDSTWN